MQLAERIQEKTVLIDQTKSHLHPGNIGKRKKERKCDTCRKTFVNKDDQLLSCEYCGNFRCIQCLGINKTVYRGISGRPDLPWFCSNCVMKSLESLRQTKTIEDKCKDFISEFQRQVEERMSKIEGEVINTRSDIVSMKDDLIKEVKDSLKKDNVSNPIDCSSENNNATPSSPWASRKVSTDSIVKKATSEMQARLARKDNIAFYNVTEPTGNLKSEIIQQDKDSVIEICNEMSTNDVDQANLLNSQFHSVFSVRAPLNLMKLCHTTMLNGASSLVSLLPECMQCKFPIMKDIVISTAGVPNSSLTLMFLRRLVLMP